MHRWAKIQATEDNHVGFVKKPTQDQLRRGSSMKVLPGSPRSDDSTSPLTSGSGGEPGDSISIDGPGEIVGLPKKKARMGAFLSSSLKRAATQIWDYHKLAATRAELYEQDPEDGKIALHRAAASGQLAEVLRLLSEERQYYQIFDKKGLSLSIGMLDNKKKTALHYAATKEIAQLLIDAGSNMMALDRRKQTPLHCVASIGVLEAFIENLPADKIETVFLSRDNNGELPLHTMAHILGMKDTHSIKLTSSDGSAREAGIEERKANLARILQRFGLNVLNAETEPQKKTAIHIAAEEGNDIFVEALIEANASVDEEDVRKKTPLHGAANAAIATMLVKANNGDSVMVQDDSLMTPLHCAAMRGKADVVAILIDAAKVKAEKQYGSGSKRVRKAILKYLQMQDRLERYAQQYAYEASFDTSQVKANALALLEPLPLHKAVIDGDLEAVNQCLKLFKDAVNQQDNRGLTALHKVTNAEIATVLLDNGARLDILADGNWTALHKAVFQDNLQVAKQFIEQCDAESRVSFINFPTVHGDTALHIARSGQVAKLLIDNGADIEALTYLDRNREARTPLYTAVMERRVHVINEILNKVEALGKTKGSRWVRAYINREDAYNSALAVAKKCFTHNQLEIEALKRMMLLNSDK